MRIASCPHCGMRKPAFNKESMKVTCPRCRSVTQVLTAAAFLRRAEALWPDAEVTLRSGRVARVIEKHDRYLKGRGDYDIITATLDENWQGDGDCDVGNNNEND
jgi:hypothetical protein